MEKMWGVRDQGEVGQLSQSPQPPCAPRLSIAKLAPTHQLWRNRCVDTKKSKLSASPSVPFFLPLHSPFPVSHHTRHGQTGWIRPAFREAEGGRRQKSWIPTPHGCRPFLSQCYPTATISTYPHICPTFPCRLTSTAALPPSLLHARAVSHTDSHCAHLAATRKVSDCRPFNAGAQSETHARSSGHTRAEQVLAHTLALI
jgi:hypothetical protein